jgi:hypothetical protein
VLFGGSTAPNSEVWMLENVMSILNARR